MPGCVAEMPRRQARCQRSTIAAGEVGLPVFTAPVIEPERFDDRRPAREVGLDRRGESCGVPPIGALLSLVERFAVPASLSPSLIAALSLAMIGCGVCAGANNPVQAVVTKSGNPLSTMVGTSGNSGMRFGRRDRERAQPAGLDQRQQHAGASNVICTLPATTSLIDGPPPL